MASFADIQSAWQAGANPPPPPAPDDGNASFTPPTMHVMPPKAMVTGEKPTSFADIQKAWSDKAPPPADFKDDNGPTYGAIAKDVAKQAGASAVEGPVMMTVGAPGDFASASKSGGLFDKAFLGLTHKLQDWTGLGPQAGSPEREKFDNDYLGGTKRFDPLWNAVQTPTTHDIISDAGIQLPEPETAAGRYTRMAGDFAAGAVTGNAPGLVAKAVEGGVAPAIAQAAKTAAPAAVSGAGAQAATDYANMTGNEDLAPVAQVAGAALTHGAVSGGAAAAGKVASAAADSPAFAKALTVTPGLRTVGEGMQENIAARRFADSISDLPAFLEHLKPKPGGDLAISRFKPTTYQLTGDPGAGQLELSSKGGEDRAAQFLARTEQQKTAQSQAAQGLQTPGDPAAVAQLAQQHMDNLDAAADQAHDAARAAAEQKAGEIGTGATPDETGADLRSHLDEASAASKKAYRALYDTIDPDKTLGADTKAITDGAQKIYGELSPTAQAFISPDERKLLDIVQGYSPTMPFSEVTDLKSAMADTLRSARASGDSRVVARLSQLMEPIQRSIKGSIQEKAANDAQAVASGEMSPEDAMEARMRAYLAPDMERFYAGRAASYDQRAATGTGGGGTGGQIAFVGSPRTARQAAGGFTDASGNQRGSPPSYRLPTAEDSANLRAADAAFKQHQQTYSEGPLRSIMAAGPRAGEYKLADYAVPAKVLRNGPAGYRTVKSYLDGAGNAPEAVESLKSAMTETLRPQIKDGMLSGTALAAWKNRLSHALRAIDEAEPGFSEKFNDAASASDAVLQAARSKVEQQRAFKASAVGKFLGVEDADGVVSRVGRMLTSDDGAAKMREAVEATKADPAAAAGLQNATGQWLARKFTTLDKIGMTDEHALNPRQFRELFAKNEPALREVLTPGQLEVAGRIAETMDQAQRSVKGNRLEGGSDTAQKLAAEKLFKKDTGGGHGGLLGALAAGAALGYEHSGVKGAVLGSVPAGAGYLLKTLRSAGLHDIQDIAFDAIMNPDRARQLMKRLSANDFRERRLDGALRNSFIRQSNGPEKDDPSGSAPPNEPPPTGPFSRGAGAAQNGRSSTELQEPQETAGAAQKQPNVPLTGRQARILRAAGYNGVDIRSMSPQERAAALQAAMDAGVSPTGRLTPADRADMGGAIAHAQHDGRSGDGRFARSGDILTHPDLNGRVEPTFHPDAEATHQAILEHEKRLHGMATQLGADASVRDIAGVTKRASDDVLAMVRAYHGTPHDFDRFDVSKIGTGEGAQAYGHGLYFAENESVAHSYKDALAIGNPESAAREWLDKHEAAREWHGSKYGDPRQTAAEEIEGNLRDFGHHMTSHQRESLKNAIELLRSGQEIKSTSGNIYQVAIDREPEHFLDWDSHEQSDYVRRALESIDGIDRTNLKPLQNPRWIEDEGDLHLANPDDPEAPLASIARLTGGGYRVFLGEGRHRDYTSLDNAKYYGERFAAQARAGADEWDQALGRQPYGTSGIDAAAARELSRAGIAGIRYLDQGSRGDGEGTRNYVVFDDKDIKITHRNGEPVPDDVRETILAKRRSSSEAPSQRSSAAPISFASALQSVGDDGILAKRLAGLVGDTPVHTVSGNDMRALTKGMTAAQSGGDVVAYYHPGEKKIVMRQGEMDAPTLIHEGLHAALSHVIDGSDAARNIVDHLRSTALAMHFERGGMQDEHYGLTNAHEFVSEAMSNPEFQRFLSSLPADDRMIRAFGLQNTGRTMWDALVGAIRKILGLQPGQHTYLDAAMKVTGHLLDAAEAGRTTSPTAGDKGVLPMFAGSRSKTADRMEGWLYPPPAGAGNALIRELQRLHL